MFASSRSFRSLPVVPKSHSLRLLLALHLPVVLPAQAVAAVADLSRLGRLAARWWRGALGAEPRQVVRALAAVVLGVQLVQVGEGLPATLP